MSFRHQLTRFFRTLFNRPAPALSEREVLTQEIERRNRARANAPLDAACRANELSRSETARVYRAFEEMAPRVGFAEARQHARNLAASIASHRRARHHRRPQPWDHTTPPAAA